MELWFWAAVVGAILAGISNFFFKIASKRNYSSELFSLYGGLVSLIFAGIALMITGDALFTYAYVALVTVVAGAVATLGGIMKVYALRHIDTTIFFPLFKLLAPLLAIIAGIVFFGEQHTFYEYLGIVLSLTVPLILITNAERGRQSNLTAGLIFVVLISTTSALAAFLNKYAIDVGMTEVATLWYSSIGIFIGTSILMTTKLGIGAAWRSVTEQSDWQLIGYATTRAILISVAMLLVLFAYGSGGTLGVVQTIHSLYIIIPIVLSIIFYQEHWNLPKAVAVVVSIVALGFLG